MVSSALFSTEVSALENQVTQLQNQILAAQSRITALGECEAEADGLLQAAQKTIGRISALAPDAVATIKTALLGLFGGGDTRGDGGIQPPSNGGPLPIAPSPASPAGTKPEKHAVRQGVVCRGQLVAPAESVAETLISADAPELAGQHSPLTCQLTDAPLMGQAYHLTCDSYVQDKEPQVIAETAISASVSINKERYVAEAQDLFQLVNLSDTVAYMKRSSDGEILCCYLGGSNKQTLKAWGEWLCLVHSVGTKFEPRTAQRLTQFKHELKVWGMSLTQIQRLAESDTMKRPPSNFGPAPKRQSAKVPTDLEISDYKAGDVVRSATVRNWSYTVLAVTSDGLLEVERIGINPPIKSTLSPASVELIRRGGVVEVVSQELAEHLEKQAQESIQPLLHPPARIDSNDVPDGVRLLHGRDDLLNQFEVLMTVEARVMGRIQRQQKQIGILTEVSGGVEALRPRASIGQVFGRTLDAVAYLIAGSGYKPLHSVKEPVLIGAVSVDDDDF